jgi:hypothetical protein
MESQTLSISSGQFFQEEPVSALLIGPHLCDILPIQDLDYFFENGLLTNQCDNKLGAVTRLYQLEGFTICQAYVLMQFLAWCSFRDMLISAIRDDANQFSYIIMRLLEYRAPITLLVIVDNYEKPVDGIVLRFNFTKIPVVRFKPHGMRYETFNNKEVWLKPQGRNKLTLRQWIVAMDLKDNNYILHLLDHDYSSGGAQRLDTSEVPLKHPLDE